MTKGKYLLYKLFAAAALLPILMGSNANAETLRVGTECTYAPFNYRTADGVLTGYDIDVAKGVADLIGAEVDFVCQQWDGMIPSLLANKFDIIVASMSITEKRLKKMDFSSPYRISVGQFIGKKGANLNLFKEDGTPNPANFKGIKVGLPRASTYDNWMKAIVPDAEVLRYDGAEEMYLELENGRADVIMTNPMKGFLKFLSKENGKGFEFVSPPLSNQEYFGTGVGIGLHKGSDELKERINGAIKTLTENGSLETYSLKYFPFSIHPEKYVTIQ
jgi:polar amino acid transport system substrate-binding protein